MAVVVPLNFLTLILGNTVITEVERQISLETQNALNLYMDQVDDAMKRINTDLYVLARENENFARLNLKAVVDRDEYYRQMQCVVSLGNDFTEELEDNSLVDGVYAFFPEKDYVVQSQSSRLSTELIKNFVMDRGEDEYRDWHVELIDGAPYLFLVSAYKNAYYGAWISLSELAKTVGFFEERKSELQAFTSTTGTVYNATKGDVTQLNMTTPSQKYNGLSYTLVKAESRYADLCYVQVLSKSQMASSLPSAIRVLQILSVVAVLIIPVILWAMQHWIARPVGKLVRAMERIEQGDVDYRIEKSKVGSDFDLINNHFNRVMDEVSELKINMYEQQLKNEKVRLGFLSQQIQPHFIINTLNILYSYEPEEYQLSQKMILCLSKYFRYVVNAPQDYVELGQEMEHIRNYFEIQQARFLRSFQATVVYDEEVADCLIPPLIIQNFTENAIKHSFIPGQMTSIVAEARKEGGDRIHICVYDTGAGIPDEVLERIAEFRENREFRMDLGVGIQNSIDRLDLLYGDQASLDISRIDPQGTRIDIMIPIKRKESDADERDFG